MSAKPAKPDRYLVERTGTPDPPSSQYYVLDIVNDLTARTVLAQLGNLYRRANLEVRATEAFAALHETQAAHMAIVVARNGVEKKLTKAKRRVIQD